MKQKQSFCNEVGKTLPFNEWFAVILWLHESLQEIYFVKNCVKIFWKILAGLSKAALTRQSSDNTNTNTWKSTKMTNSSRIDKFPRTFYLGYTVNLRSFTLFDGAFFLTFGFILLHTITQWSHITCIAIKKCIFEFWWCIV